MRADPLQGQLLEVAIAKLTQEFHHTTGIYQYHILNIDTPIDYQG
ncbi:MAG: hypothetical protein V7L00_29395 [Nostoc sp.]